MALQRDTTREWIVTGGHVVPLWGEDPLDGRPWTIAGRGDHIVSVGVDAQRAVSTGAINIDGTGCFIFPGFIDAHGHLFWLGQVLSRLSLKSARSVADVRDIIRGHCAQTPSKHQESWVLGEGWDHTQWETGRENFPTGRDLEGIADRPIALTRVDGHALWVDAKALALANIHAGTKDPPGGAIMRLPSGEPSGVLVDRAMDLVLSVIPPPTREVREQWLAAACVALSQSGVTGFHDCGLDEEELGILRDWDDRGELPIRVHAMINGTRRDLLAKWLERGPYVSGRRLQIRAVKLFADGALGSRGAFLLEPYEDAPESCGLALETEDALKDLATKAMRRGFQVATHGIGDGAVRRILDAYEGARQRVGAAASAAVRLRLEHSQIVHPQDVPRFAALDVIASIQTCHCTADAPWTAKRLGNDRARERAHPWRALLSHGARICNGTDAPVASPSPLHNLHAALARQGDESLTPLEGLRAMTAWAAYASFWDGDSGQIAAGFRGDFTILDKNIARLPLDEIVKTRVAATVVGGQVTWRRS